MKISTVIITYNEEDRLEPTLKSCSEIADEIVVVDSFSTDKTIDILKKYKVKIFQKKFIDYGSQKNLAMGKAKNEWILNLDADERVSKELKKNIIKLKQKHKMNTDGFLINRKTFYMGKWIKHSGWYPDRKLRLFRKSKSRWQGRIHERLILNGKIQKIDGDILHFTYRNITDHINRINRYSKMQAEDIVRKKTKFIYLRFFLLPPITFMRFYFWKMGILDGFSGIIIAMVSCWGTAMKYMKAIEIKREKKSN